MKIIHTGDWHIGKIVNEFSMIDDQIYILDELIEVLKKEKPDALVIAGDLYDRSIPPAKAVEVLNNFFNKVILKMKIPILAIAGNHDSGERLEFGSSILENQGLYIEGTLKNAIRKVILYDEYGEVDFYLIPYADPVVIRHLFNDNEIKTHEDAMKKLIDLINNNRDKRRRSIIVTHGYVTFMKENYINEKNREEIIEKSSLEICDSERPLSIGGTDLISAKIFEDFNYVALGHLHGPQKVGTNKIRYSGSLLKYSFSEERQKKSVTIVEIDEDGSVQVKLTPLVSKRDMRTLTGHLDYLISKEFYKLNNKEDYIFAFLTDDGEVYEPISKLRAIYPNVMGVRRAINTTLERKEINLNKDYRNKSKLELFKDFYENVTQKDFFDDRKDIILKVIEEIDKGEV
ncbi:exonuclease SbcCD subunit D [Clostridium tarantellae]|uniref:Nuclease SbcCD subunit D n=1 Tax=Clostridium tarantellae TaxID=39493 RepID=A0A6I1MI38_9CLOT|nr:exonuclease SbcCD subunit D [Clostridium tarantellae]MPQ42564.1 exonuclease subunit SbcD [Clostridium tarantellae]